MKVLVRVRVRDIVKVRVLDWVIVGVQVIVR